ncbi:MAG: hypothetical protein U9N51_05715 [Bacteroidota bacterium]|nr:hypothetical protein [Bacteroidota bacterium]
MRSINIIIALSLSVSCLTAFGQFSTKSEYDYLKLINSQQNQTLIKDNLKNLETVVHRVIASENDNISAYFFNELANSYNIIGQKELAFFYILVQRSLFPNDSLSTFQENNFRELAYSLNLGKNATKTYWDKTLSQKIPQNYKNRIILLLELSTELHFKKLTQINYKIGLILRNKSEKIPAWYQHWEFLTIIGVNEKQKEQIIHPEKYPYQPIFSHIEGENKIKVYRKAIKHNIKADAKVHAKELIVDYQTQDLSIFEKIDLIIKKLRLELK